MNKTRATNLHWKYRLRLVGVPLLARLGRCVGLSWDSLGNRLGREVLLAQLPSVSRNHVSAERRTTRPLDVVCLTMMGGNHRLASATIRFHVIRFFWLRR